MNIDRKHLDQLVDGELHDVDRRRLIESFEQQPDGWRQCASAFLESQEIGAALNSFVDRDATPLLVIDHDAALRLDDKSARPFETARWWAALAACLVIGFGIGQFGGRGESVLQPSPIASDPSSETSPGDQDQSRLIAADDNLGRVAREPRGESILEQQYSAIPSDIVDILDRLGQRIERRQVFVPVQNGRVQGGRPDAMPVEEIEIVPVRWGTY